MSDFPKRCDELRPAAEPLSLARNDLIHPAIKFFLK